MVSNDDFQLDIYRFFRQKNLFYERREREWRQRSRELKSVGIHQGPSIKKLTQLIASFHWNKKKLGPANAKHSAGELFEGATYEVIRETPAELAYQIYLVGKNLDACIKTLSESKQYIHNLRAHINLAAFAVIAKTLKAAGAEWGDLRFTDLLDTQVSDWPQDEKRWCRLSKACIDQIVSCYKSEAQLFYKSYGKDLTPSNYFKTQLYVGKALNVPTSDKLKEMAQASLA